MAKLPRLALAALLALGSASCAAEIAGYDTPPEAEEPGESEPEPEEPGEPDPGEPEPGEPEPQPQPGFDVNDPADYRWSVRLEAFYTLPVLRGTAQVNWSRFAPGDDPLTATASDGATLSGPVLVAEDLSYAQLLGTLFRFETLREEDGHPMTSCIKFVEGEAAIASHNGILSSGYPSFDLTGFTNPNLYAAHLAEQPGVLLMVNGDCRDPSPSNPTEARSVLDFAAVTFMATPDPQIFDPSVDPDPAAGIHP